MQKKCARACVYEKYFVSLQPLMKVDSSYLALLERLFSTSENLDS